MACFTPQKGAHPPGQPDAEVFRCIQMLNKRYIFLLIKIFIFIYLFIFVNNKNKLKSGIGWPKVPTVTPHTHPRASYGRDSWRPRRHSFGKKRSILHVNHSILRLRFRLTQTFTSPGAPFSLVKWRALRRKKAHIRLANPTQRYSDVFRC